MVALNALTLLTAAAVGQAASSDLVLLEFTAAGCGPCQQMKPVLARLQGMGYPIQQVDFDRRQDLAQRFRVTRVPTFVLVSGGREVSRVVGAVSGQELAAMFASVRRPPAGSAAAPAPSAAAASVSGVPTIDFQLQPAAPASPRMSAPPMPPTMPAPPRMSAPPMPPTMPAPPRTSAPPSVAQGGPVASQPRAYQEAPPTRPASSASQGRPFTPAPAPAADPSTRGESAGSYAQAEGRAYEATVRLQVRDDRGMGFATGTIIDIHGPEVLVLTCGHVFKESQGRGEILIDTFYPNGPKQIAGRLVSWEVNDHDVGLVSFRPPQLPAPAPLAPGKTYRPGDLVFTLGCSKGADPTRQLTKITTIDRYQGASNIEIAGEPVDGRSGGGLFNEAGQLIGVCNAADPTDHEGIYAALPAIHDHLAVNGMSHLIGGGQLVSAPSPPAAPLAAAEPERRAGPGVSEINRLPSVPPPAVGPGPVEVNPISHATPRGGSATSGGGSREVIVVVRGSDSGPDRVLTIRQPSPQLLEQLQRESAGESSPPATRPADPVYSAGALTPIVRAQNRR